METYAERLVKVRAAIDAVLTDGQAIVTLDGRSFRAADLEALQRLEERYERLAAREQQGSIFDRARAGIPYRGGC